MGDPLVIFEWLGILIAAFHWDDALKLIKARAADYVDGDNEGGWDDPEVSALWKMARGRTGREDSTDPRWYLRATRPDEFLEVPSYELLRVRTDGEGEGILWWRGLSYQLADIVRAGWTCDLES